MIKPADLDRLFAELGPELVRLHVRILEAAWAQSSTIHRMFPPKQPEEAVDAAIAARKSVIGWHNDTDAEVLKGSVVMAPSGVPLGAAAEPIPPRSSGRVVYAGSAEVAWTNRYAPQDLPWDAGIRQARQALDALPNGWERTTLRPFPDNDQDDVFDGWDNAVAVLLDCDDDDNDCDGGTP